jgi:protein-tyrosine phosphatase
MIDTHCHILPGLDDGPSDWDQSLRLATLLELDGITEVIATPHLLGQFDNLDRAERIREDVRFLNDKLRDSGLDLKVFPGAEVRLDRRITGLLEENKLLTLADSRYVLVELPSEIWIDIESFIRDLVQMGYAPVIAHVERLLYLLQKPGVLHRWLEAGAFLQVTAPGLLNGWGRQVADFGWNLVLSGMASLVATDAHDGSTRKPRLKDVYEQIVAWMGLHIAERLCCINPQSVLESEKMQPVFLAQNARFNHH